MAQELSRPLVDDAILTVRSAAHAAVVDIDNLQNRGPGRERAVLDVVGFGTAMRARGVTAGAVFQNYPYSVVSDKLWRELGFVPVSTAENADRYVALAAIHYVLEADCRHIALVSSDGGFTNLVERMRACEVQVDVMGLRRLTARTLRRAASTVEYVDKWLIEPPEVLPRFYLHSVANRYGHQRIDRVGQRPRAIRTTGAPHD